MITPLGGNLLGSTHNRGAMRLSSRYWQALWASARTVSKSGITEDAGQLEEQAETSGQWKIWFVVFAALFLALVLAF